MAERATITINSVIQQDGRVVFETDQGRFSFFEKGYDSDKDSLQYVNYKKLGLRKGSTIGVEYTEKVSEKGTLRNIKSFEAPDGQGAVPPSAPPVRSSGASRRDEPDWDAIALGKVRHGVVVALLGQGKTLPEIYALTPEIVSYVMTGIEPASEFSRNPNGPEAEIGEPPKMDATDYAKHSRGDIIGSIRAWEMSIIEAQGDETGSQTVADTIWTAAGLKVGDLVPIPGKRGPTIASLAAAAAALEAAFREIG